MTGHAQLKFVMTECSKTQISLTRLIFLDDSACYADDVAPLFILISHEPPNVLVIVCLNSISIMVCMVEKIQK